MIHKLIAPRPPQPLLRKSLLQHPNSLARNLKAKAMKRAIDEFEATYRASS